MKVAYIMRGIPGSGKTTTVQDLIRGYENPQLEVAVHSTDDLFYVDSVFRFDPRKLSKHHDQNLVNFRKSVEAGVPCVICDNTNIKVEHYQPYVDAATEAGYRVVIVQMTHPTVEQAFNRNKHGVPRETIARMMHGFEPPVESKEQNHRLEAATAARVARHVTEYVQGVEREAARKERVYYVLGGISLGIFVMSLAIIVCGALA